MVRGTLMAVTAVMLTYQCAETTRTALGLGNVAANADQLSVYRLWSSRVHGAAVTDEGSGHQL